MKQQHKFSLGYYPLVFLSIILLESIFFSGAAVKEISYSRFRNLLSGDRIRSVIVESDRIFGIEKAPAAAGGSVEKESPAFQPPLKKAPWNLDFGLFNDKAKQQVERQFVVTYLDDPNLIADLQAHGVDYRGKIESHWLSNFLSNWILPLAFFILLGRFLARRLKKAPVSWMQARTKPVSMPWIPHRRSHSTMWRVWTKPWRKSRRWSRFSKVRGTTPGWAPNCLRGFF